MSDARTFVHGLWSSVAASWIERADYLEERGANVTKAILERAAIDSSDRVLALADGTGGMALAAAAIAGDVVSSDVVPAMVDAAARRASEAGVANVAARVLDIEAIDEPDASFDVVVSREGLMFAVERQRAFDEIARVLRSNGRLAAAVWGAPAANPWLAVVMDAVSEAVGHPVPPPGMPGPFALSDEADVLAMLDRAGFRDATIDHVEVPFHAPSFDTWWNHTTALAGPIANIVKGFDAETTASLLTQLRERVAPYTSSDGALEIPGESLVISARRA